MADKTLDIYMEIEAENNCWQPPKLVSITESFMAERFSQLPYLLKNNNR